VRGSYRKPSIYSCFADGAERMGMTTPSRMSAA
jgi:hypothetical protein